MTDPQDGEVAPMDAGRLSNQEVRTLLLAALSINDKFRISVDHVEFHGSMNDAEDFRELVNRLWHKGGDPPPSQAALDFAESHALRWFGSTEALDCAELARALDRFAASRLAEAEKVIAEFTECAEYDATMEGPKFKGWNRSALDRLRVKLEAAYRSTGERDG